MIQPIFYSKLFKNNFSCSWLLNLHARSITSNNWSVSDNLRIDGKEYIKDNWTNVTPRIIDKMNKGLHNDKHHPLGIIMARIKEYFYQNFRKPTGRPIYSIYDNIGPVVSVKQNFDDLLIPVDHISREMSNTYYINSQYLFRAHTSAHEADLIKSGLDAFLVAGDVYRRDEIDSTHYPVFHQVEGVRLFTKHELFKDVPNDVSHQLLLDTPSLRLRPGERPVDRQERHGQLTAKMLEHELKIVLEKLATFLFGRAINYRWVPAFFPWTRPSFELEVEVSPGVWMEMLGCGVIEQDMLDQCGAGDRVGFAFGLGLERWAMKLFAIPDIRVFWSNDPGFLHQFNTDNIHSPIKFKPISSFPACSCDISFWLPNSDCRQFHDNDFYELVGSIAGDLVERVHMVDKYVDASTMRTSNCYRVVYRHMSKNLTQQEVNVVHNKISKAVHEQLGCVVR